MPSDESSMRRLAMRVTENTFAALVRSFRNSPDFAGYAEATRNLWGRELDFASDPDCLGGLSLDAIKPALTQGYLDGLASRPGKQAAALSALKALDKWASRRDVVSRSFTFGVETGRPQGSHTPWTAEEVELGERCARPDLARVITLGAHTGQRGSDLIRMGPTDIESYKGHQGIRVIQKKTGREVWIPIIPALAQKMATWELRPGPYLRRLDGAPWQRPELTSAWCYEREHNRALGPLAGLVLHGLRGYACVTLSRAGLTDHQIHDIVGMSIPMVARYTRHSAQRENAIAGIIHYETFAKRKSHMSNK